MTHYPSAQERAEIMARREQLMKELIHVLVLDERQDENIASLVQCYGQAEVERMLRGFQSDAMRRSNVEDDEVNLYQEYVETYRRFGGQRPFLWPEEYARLTREFIELYARQELGRSISETDALRLSELQDLMLKAPLLWDDITPPDPPANVPEVDQASLAVLKDGLPGLELSIAPDRPRCKQDGFPLLTINGCQECVAEYLNRCIGSQKIVNVVRHGKTTYYVFENGHELPLLCSCCGGPLAVPEDESQRMCGRRLEAMSVDWQQLEDGREVEELVLEFSKKGLLSQPAYMPVAFEVAQKIKHPAECPNKGRAPRSKRRFKKRR